jgi:hypothetical protein
MKLALGRNRTHVFAGDAVKDLQATAPFKFLGLEQEPISGYRESSQIQLTSQVFPPSGEKDCSMRAAVGERLSQT